MSNYKLIKMISDLFEFVRANPDKPWDWSYLSQNPNITMEDVCANPDKPWNWYGVSMNPNITMEDVIEHPDKPWNWSGLSRNPNITVEDIRANPDKPWDWHLLSCNPNITIEFVHANPDKPWDWHRLSCNPMGAGRKKHRFTPYIRAKKIKTLIPKLQPIFVERKIIPLQRWIKQIIYAREDFVLSQLLSTQWRF